MSYSNYSHACLSTLIDSMKSRLTTFLLKNPTLTVVLLFTLGPILSVILFGSCKMWSKLWTLTRFYYHAVRMAGRHDWVFLRLAGEQGLFWYLDIFCEFRGIESSVCEGNCNVFTDVSHSSCIYLYSDLENRRIKIWQTKTKYLDFVGSLDCFRLRYDALQPGIALHIFQVVGSAFPVRTPEERPPTCHGRGNRDVGEYENRATDDTHNFLYTIDLNHITLENKSTLTLHTIVRSCMPNNKNRLISKADFDKIDI